MIQIALIGDVHGYFNSEDAEYFNSSNYDLILFTGDISDYTKSTTIKALQNMAKINKPAFMIPGNWDSTNLFQLAGELFHFQILKKIGSRGHKIRLLELKKIIQNINIEYYYYKCINISGFDFGIIFARPFSMGGPSLYFEEFLFKEFGIRSISDSFEYLKKVILSCPNKELIFLAHNGPSGLGGERTDICGADFKKNGGDFGDPDLEKAIDFAKSLGKKVHAVLFGHLHRFKNQSGTRKFLITLNDTLYVNAAEVPRIQNGKRHHVKIILSKEGVSSEEIWVQ